MPASQPDVNEEHWAKQIEESLVLRDVDPHEMVPNYEDGRGSHVILAMPVSKVALATDGDVYETLKEDGWLVKQIPVGSLKAFASTARELTSLAVDHNVRSAGSQMIKTGSEDEARLLNGILRAHLPAPDRNFRIMREEDPSKELTTPDFTWPNERVAFFMDGLWWHVGLDSDTKKKEFLADEKNRDEAEKQQKARATKDASNRSEMAVMGWMVLSCSDEDIADEKGVARQVERIKKALRAARGRASDGPPLTETKASAAMPDTKDPLDQFLN